MKYDYVEAMKEDVRQYLKEDFDFSEFDTMEELEEKLNDELWLVDSVTGNASGSYTFDAYEAEENICHNLDLLYEAAYEFGYDLSILEKGAEYADIVIRCYLLGSIIAEVLPEFEKEFNEAHEERSESNE